MPSILEKAPNLLGDYLDRSREMITREIMRVIPADHRNSGGLYKLMSEYPLREGKALRPALCLAVARLLGGYVQEAIPTAACLELFHNAFLIHDDVEDRSSLRRGSTTLNGLYGDPVAINVGDAMLGLTLEPLLENTERIGLGRTLEIFSLVSKMVKQTAEGQMMELDWIRRNAWDVRESDYIRMVHKKTSWYSFLSPVACGCLTTGRRDMLPALGRFAILLGIAFQIQDDVLNLASRTAEYGKEEAGDLWEGKRTMILIHALRNAGDETKRKMLAVLGKSRSNPEAGPRTDRRGDPGINPDGTECKTEADIRFLMEVIQECGSLEYARGQACRRALRARRQLEASFPGIRENIHGQFLWELTEYVVNRPR